MSESKLCQLRRIRQLRNNYAVQFRKGYGNGRSGKTPSPHQRHYQDLIGVAIHNQFGTKNLEHIPPTVDSDTKTGSTFHQMWIVIPNS